MPGLQTKIDHIIVLMLENRSFDCMLGKLYPAGPAFVGLTGQEVNPFAPPTGPVQQIGVWSDPTSDPGWMTIPDPDPGEKFTEMNMQLFGLGGVPGPAPPPMSGFVDNYMRQPPADAPYSARAPMHHYTQAQLPVMYQLAQSFAVCDQWHASAPCQTWPNRFFAHTATAGGFVNNSPPHFPYRMPSIFHQLAQAGGSSRVYFHDIPQSLTLADQWATALERFRPIDRFWDDADHGDLADYSFIEPRYFADDVLGAMPNDQHPPHDVVYGEQLIAQIYNAVRGSPAWKRTLLVITYDEHGGCYDHVAPPAAAPPLPQPGPDGFLFDRYGVRVPALVISPYTAAGTVLRAGPGAPPFDHTAIIRTVRDRFDPGGAPLTGRDAVAPSLDLALTLGQPANDGPDQIDVPTHVPDASELARARSMPPNDFQHSLAAMTAFLPPFGADVPAHIDALASQLKSIFVPRHDSVADAASFARENLRSFLGTD